METVKSIGSTLSAIFINYLVYRLFMVLALLSVMFFFGSDMYTSDQISVVKYFFFAVQIALIVYGYVKRVYIQSVWGLLLCLLTLGVFEFAHLFLAGTISL